MMAEEDKQMKNKLLAELRECGEKIKEMGGRESVARQIERR